MFVRVKRSGRLGEGHEYLQIVQSVRDGSKVRQRVIATLGRRDELVSSGAVDGLVTSLARFSERVRVIDAARVASFGAQARAWGPALVFGRLWEAQGLPEVLERLAEGRRFSFDVERLAFAIALQRLCSPGSDLQGSGWVKSVEARGFADMELHHFYRTCGFLASVREALEQALFFKDRDLFSEGLDLVFIDTTSTFVYRDTETTFRKRGYSRDHRGDLPQFVLCVAVDRNGWPIAWEIFAGNTADATALRKLIETLRQRFKVRRAVVVADRGMISQDTIALLTEDKDAPFDFVLGCRMRQQKEVTEEVLARAGRYHVVAGNLQVKEVRVGPRRYIVCRNPEEAAKDAAARAVIVEKLEEEVKQRPKSLVKNRGFARFLTLGAGAVSVSREAIEADARLDGKFVLRTNTDLPPSEVALTYKGLWRVERSFRETKSTLEVRPIFHHRDDTSMGHIVGCFLALRLEVDLQRRLDERGVPVSWPELMRDLGQLQAVRVDLDGRRFLLRTDLVGEAHSAFAAAGVRVPPVITEMGPVPEPPPTGEDEAM
jgi:hypothetical protein